MTDEPQSLGEIARQIKNLETLIDRRFNTIEQRQDRLVSVDLYQSNLAHTDRQIEQLRQALAEERQARVDAIAAEAKDREDAAADNRERIKSVGNTARWSAVFAVMVLGVFLTILFRGAGTV